MSTVGASGLMRFSAYTNGLPAEGIITASSAPASRSSWRQRSAQASMSSLCSGKALILGMRIRLASSSRNRASFSSMYCLISIRLCVYRTQRRKSAKFFNECPQKANVGAYRIRPENIRVDKVCAFGRIRYAPTINWVKCGHS